MAEVTARTSVPSDQRVESTQLNRVGEALRTQQTFTSEQLAWLMGAAQRWGYEAGYEDGRADEISLSAVTAHYAQLGPFSAELTWRETSKRARRQESDSSARLPRIGDHPGGPVAWDEPNEQQAAA